MIILTVLLMGATVLALLLGSAGRWNVPAFFAYAALLSLSAASIQAVALLRHPDLVAERLKPPSDRDRATRRIATPLMLGHYVLAGLDVGRFGWSAVATAAQIAGFLLVAAGMFLVGWTLQANRFASSAVRIQHDRGQQVITSGPYAIVRHPMYLGVFLFALGSGPALGSWWSSLPLLPVILVFIRRTLFEDRMLHAELPGYPAYASQVRWRILPGLF
jgi:protein-S-isoprenylcysteine O-methyltransferase Ste14